MVQMPLTDTQLRTLKAREKIYTVTDMDGLAVRVLTSGTRTWQFRYQLDGKGHQFSFGVYPEITLREARDMRDRARALLARGECPRSVRKNLPEKTDDALVKFADVAERWQELRIGRLKSESRQGSISQSQRYLAKEVLPAIGRKPIADVTRAEVLSILRRIEARGALNVATKVRTWLSQIFRHAIAEGHITLNPASDLDVVAMPVPKPRHNPSLKLSEVHEFIQALNAAQNMSIITRIGIKILLLTAVRTGELRQASLSQIDLDAGIWTIPAGAVKQLHAATQKGHVDDYLVPLSRQAIDAFSELIPLTGKYKYLFPNRNDPHKQMSENTINVGVKRLGYEGRLTGHGIRGTVSTALYESALWEGDWIEAQLSHADGNKSRASYNHASYVEQRRGMMQWWADQIYGD